MTCRERYDKPQAARMPLNLKRVQTTVVCNINDVTSPLGVEVEDNR